MQLSLMDSLHLPLCICQTLNFFIVFKGQWKAHFCPHVGTRFSQDEKKLGGEYRKNKLEFKST